jgi:signal transduction histidine kinase
MHAQAFSQAGQRIFVSPDSESGVIIFADAGAIEEVLTNIISNCHKHAGQGASICVRITKNKDQTASVEVIDDGFGMTPDVLKNTRKAMQNPNSILTGKNHLGLQISARLIALHGGASWIKSRSRRGTTVGFSLPSE